jgi:hypothetical protein
LHAASILFPAWTVVLLPTILLMNK